MVGIYKITNPKGRVYVGQSVDIERRFGYYKGVQNKAYQVRLNSSFSKYGIDNHKFEILEECEVSELNDKERYYQDLYDVLGSKGLNCRLTTSSDKSGVLSIETRTKLSRKPSEETRAKLRIACIDRVFSKETRLKISQANKGKTRTETQKENHSRRLMKTVLCTETGVFYDSAMEVADTYNLNYSTLKNRLNGRAKNNTNFMYV